MDFFIDASVKDRCLKLNSVIGKHKVSINEIIDSFGSLADRVELGVTPDIREGFEVKPYHKKDCTFFYIGDDLKRVEEDKLIFPLYSHA